MLWHMVHWNLNKILVYFSQVTRLAVFTKHIKRLRLKFITFHTLIVLQNTIQVFSSSPLMDEKAHSHGLMISVAMNNRIYRFHHSRAANASHLRCISHSHPWYLLNRIADYRHKKWGNSLCHPWVVFLRLWMYTAPCKQSAPNKCPTVNIVMSQPGPSHCRWSTGLPLLSWGQRERWQYTATWMELGPRGNSCIWLISNEAQMHHDKTVGCYLEAPVKGSSIQKLDHVHWHCDWVTCCHPALNLKVGKMNYGLGNQATDWAIRSKSGQNFSRTGEKKIITKVLACTATPQMKPPVTSTGLLYKRTQERKQCIKGLRDPWTSEEFNEIVTQQSLALSSGWHCQWRPFKFNETNYCSSSNICIVPKLWCPSSALEAVLGVQIGIRRDQKFK